MHTAAKLPRTAAESLLQTCYVRCSHMYNSGALGERKHPPTLCQFFRCVRQVAALYSVEVRPI